jgi:glycosyltransferase involved in cell wall biosynthesis
VRILIDAYWWFDGPPSGKNVLRSIVTTWAHSFPQDELVLEIPRSMYTRRNEILPDFQNVQTRSRPSGLHALSVIFRRGLTGKFDSYLSQNFVSPFTRQHRSVFLHDLIFREHPEWFTAKERVYLSLILRTVRFADLVVTSSNAEAQRIARLDRKTASKVKAVGLGVPDTLREVTAVKPPLEISSRRYLLTVGRLNVRKNIEALSESLEKYEVISADFPLVIVGAPDGQTGRLSKTGGGEIDNSILSAGHASDAELKWLYQNCSVFVFPSLDEGFGLPVIEASAQGARQALSGIPAFLEFGLVAQFFDPLDQRDMANKVRAAIASPWPESDELSSKYTWERTVTTLREEIKRSKSRTRRGPSS